MHILNIPTPPTHTCTLLMHLYLHTHMYSQAKAEPVPKKKAVLTEFDDMLNMLDEEDIAELASMWIMYMYSCMVVHRSHRRLPTCTFTSLCSPVTRPLLSVPLLVGWCEVMTVKLLLNQLLAQWFVCMTVTTTRYLSLLAVMSPSVPTQLNSPLPSFLVFQPTYVTHVKKRY